MNFRYDPEQECLVVKDATRVEYHQMRVWLERHVKGYRYMPAFKMGIWSGKECYFDDGKVKLGLWRECYKACKEIGSPFSIENRDEFPMNRQVTLESVRAFCQDFFKGHRVRNQAGEWVPFMPYDYQVETAYKILKNRYCLASVATSGGKSLIICIVYFYTLRHTDPDAKMLLIVPSILLVTQFYDSIMEFNYGLNVLHEWGGRVDFRDGDLTPVREANPGWDPFRIRLEEVMSERPRKWTGPTQPNIYIGTYQSLARYPKDFFAQFHTVVCDEAHQSKAATLKSILSKTFKRAYNRFGVSGTFPGDDTLEILTIQSVLGPVITEVSANELVKLGTITPMRIKALVLNHDQAELSERLSQARKMGAGADVYRYEKDFCQASEKRLEFIRKLVARCDKNTLLLFHTIEHGQRLFSALKEALPDKEFFYIDGEISGKRRGEIKAELEKTQKVEYTVLDFGDFEVEVESEFSVLLTGGERKMAGDITGEDDIDDGFLEKLRKKYGKDSRQKKNNKGEGGG